MTDHMTETAENEEVVRTEGPGRRLREARETRHLTREQVATQLRLQVRLVIALEEDDYSGLPGNTFVQGYLRSYARLLDLPEASILALAKIEESVPPPLVSTIVSKGEASSRDLPMRLISLVLLTLVVVVIGWWFSQHEIRPSEPTVTEITPGGELSLTLPQPEPEPEPVPLGPPDGEGIPPQEEVPSETENTLVQEAVVTSSAPARAAIETPVAPLPISDDMPQSLLELQFDEESWTEVVDAAGRSLTYGLVPAGQRLELRGQAPFRVFLGYAQGVRVYYNGAAFDHTPYQRKDVARFRIGRAEHNRPLTR